MIVSSGQLGLRASQRLIDTDCLHCVVILHGPQAAQKRIVQPAYNDKPGRVHYRKKKRKKTALNSGPEPHVLNIYSYLPCNSNPHGLCMQSVQKGPKVAMLKSPITNAEVNAISCLQYPYTSSLRTLSITVSWSRSCRSCPAHDSEYSRVCHCDETKDA